MYSQCEAGVETRIGCAQFVRGIFFQRGKIAAKNVGHDERVDRTERWLGMVSAELPV